MNTNYHCKPLLLESLQYAYNTYPPLLLGLCEGHSLHCPTLPASVT